MIYFTYLNWSALISLSFFFFGGFVSHSIFAFLFYLYKSLFVSTTLIRFSFKVLPKILMKLSSCLSNLLFFAVTGHSVIYSNAVSFLWNLSFPIPILPFALFLHFYLDDVYSGMKCGKFDCQDILIHFFFSLPSRLKAGKLGLWLDYPDNQGDS